MYSIDPTITRVEDLTTGAITDYNIAPVNPFDLRNTSIYDKEGNIVKEAKNPKDYDFPFSMLLQRTYPLYECEDVLKHHYEKTPDRALFLKHIEFSILLNPYLKAQKEKCKYIKNWIQEKKTAEENNTLGTDGIVSAINQYVEAMQQVSVSTIPEDKMDEYFKWIYAYTHRLYDYIISYIDTVCEVFYKVTSKRVVELEELAIHFKKKSIEVYEHLLTNLDVKLSLHLIKDTLYELEKRNILAQVENKLPRQWDNILIQHLTNIEDCRKKEVYILSISQEVVGKEGEKVNYIPVVHNEVLEFDPNNWDQECFGLFNYLSDNYKLKAVKQKYINIWFFLVYDKGEKYHFAFSKDSYKEYIKKRFDVEVKKMNKPSNYDKNQLPILRSLLYSYRNK